jgi:catechol 2,3-dioxygenase-like lactoylglutathione lyase family enzyme
MSIVGIDHVQIGVPVGRDAECRAFYVDVLGLTEIPRPAAGAGRSILWVRAGGQEIHFRPDPDFAAAKFAHPGLLVDNIDALAERVSAAGFEVSREQSIGPGRFHTRDPFGNRLEFLQSGVTP